jgi:hypothetical protein
LLASNTVGTKETWIAELISLRDDIAKWALALSKKCMISKGLGKEIPGKVIEENEQLQYLCFHT